ncbi:hypothetical protein BDZ45DRAFT_749781 [Acephala macrosclerotiorum]|nr:hypothetical protein BDZ45DRAFT_749781 [Acephala macrosclerotiorum]
MKPHGDNRNICLVQLWVTLALPISLRPCTVSKTFQFESLTNLGVVLHLPHAFTSGLHKLRLSYVLPSYRLSFTKWALWYHVPSIDRAERVSKDDLNQLSRLNPMVLKHAGAGDKRIQALYFPYASDFEPLVAATWEKFKNKPKDKREKK